MVNSNGVNQPGWSMTILRKWPFISALYCVSSNRSSAKQRGLFYAKLALKNCYFVFVLIHLLSAVPFFTLLLSPSSTREPTGFRGSFLPSLSSILTNYCLSHHLGATASSVLDSNRRIFHDHHHLTFSSRLGLRLMRVSK